MKGKFGGDTVVADVPTNAYPQHYCSTISLGVALALAGHQHKSLQEANLAANQPYSKIMRKKTKPTMVAVMDHGSGKAHS